jgi:hypothetical protein
MSEEVVKSYLPSGSDEQMIDIIKEDAICEIKMSTGYYKRIQQVIGFIIENKPVSVIQEAHKTIAAKKITEQWVYHYETLLILCKEFEKDARANGHIEQMTISEAREAMLKAEEKAASEDSN